jgi:hypothetical protein
MGAKWYECEGVVSTLKDARWGFKGDVAAAVPTAPGRWVFCGWARW